MVYIPDRESCIVNEGYEDFKSLWGLVHVPRVEFKLDPLLNTNTVSGQNRIHHPIGACLESYITSDSIEEIKPTVKNYYKL